MTLSTQWQRARSYAIVGAWINEAYLDDKKFTLEDIDETLIAAAWLGAIWSPQLAVAFGISTTPLVVLEVAALTGLAASVAIGGVEGGAMYVDYISNPSEIITNPKKRDAFMQASEIVIGLSNPLAWVGGEVIQYGGRKIGEHKDEILRNRWVTGPYLPWV